MLRYIFLCMTMAVANAAMEDYFETISQYALGVWKYVNSTGILTTIPHS